MGYAHIDNLYKNWTILLFDEVYALEKIHGTSAHLRWRRSKIHYAPGGCKLVTFKNIFQENLKARFEELGYDKVIIYGEQHGGKMQGMSRTYGKEARFAVFEVRIEDTWLSVPNAANVTAKLGLEFVHYVKVPATLEAIDAERDAESVQAIRNGMGPDKKREGVVLRPLMEFRDNRDNRVMAKHKHETFRETKKERKVGDPTQQLEGQKAALEWVTDMRMRHVVDKVVTATGELNISLTGVVIKAMLEDIEREGGEEIVMNKHTRKAISGAASKTFHRLLPELVEQYSLLDN